MGLNMSYRFEFEYELWVLFLSVTKCFTLFCRNLQTMFRISSLHQNKLVKSLSPLFTQ